MKTKLKNTAIEDGFSFQTFSGFFLMHQALLLVQIVFQKDGRLKGGFIVFLSSCHLRAIKHQRFFVSYTYNLTDADFFLKETQKVEYNLMILQTKCCFVKNYEGDSLSEKRRI
jgi:hypothetical protein